MSYKTRATTGYTGRIEVVQSDGLVITSHTTPDGATSMCRKLSNGAGFNGHFPAFWGHTGPVILP